MKKKSVFLLSFFGCFCCCYCCCSLAYYESKKFYIRSNDSKEDEDEQKIPNQNVHYYYLLFNNILFVMSVYNVWIVRYIFYIFFYKRDDLPAVSIPKCKNDQGVAARFAYVLFLYLQKSICFLCVLFECSISSVVFCILISSSIFIYVVIIYWHMRYLFSSLYFSYIDILFSNFC